MIGQTLDSIDDVYERRVLKKLNSILQDETHPMRHDFDTLKIIRSGRFRVPKINTKRYKNSFLPTAIRKFNDKK